MTKMEPNKFKKSKKSTTGFYLNSTQSVISGYLVLYLYACTYIIVKQMQYNNVHSKMLNKTND